MEFLIPEELKDYVAIKNDRIIVKAIIPQELLKPFYKFTKDYIDAYKKFKQVKNE